MTWTWRKIGLTLVAGLAGLVLMVSLVDQILLPWYVSMSETVSVPAVIDMRVDTATAILGRRGLHVMEPRLQYSATIPKGTVMSQLPYANATVKEGRRIYLTVSNGLETTHVPSLVGLTIRDARLTLMRIGLRIGDVIYESSNNIAVDRISAQSIPPGSEIPSNGSVNVVVSRGSASIMVPNLVGLSLAEALETLVNSGLAPGPVVERPSGAFDQGTVIAHNPPADLYVPAGTSVMIVTAK